jgi:hypothetical protein
MTRLSRWLIGSIAAVVLVGAAVGTRALIAQEQGKPAAKPAAHKPQDADAKKKAQAERMATFKKLFPGAKTTLAAAVDAAEKKTKGKAFEVSYGLTKDSKLDLTVGLVADDKMVTIHVDPQTGVAADPKAPGAKGEEEEEEEEGDEDGKN